MINSNSQSNTRIREEQSKNQLDLSNFDLATFIKNTVQEAISTTIFNLQTAPSMFNMKQLASTHSATTISNKQKLLITNNFKRILNTTYELQRHIAYNNLAPLRIHNSASLYIEQYNITTNIDPLVAQQEALRKHLQSRTQFLDTLIKHQNQLITSLRHHNSNASLDPILNEAFNQAINETTATCKAVWTEVFQFTTNLGIFMCHEKLRAYQPSPKQQQQINETLRLNQLRNVYMRRKIDTTEHINKHTIPAFLAKHSAKFPSNHKNLNDDSLSDINKDWQQANFEAQRILLNAANCIFAKQLVKTDQLIQEFNTTNQLNDQLQMVHTSITKLKHIRSNVSIDHHALPHSFTRIFTSDCEPISDFDKLINLFQNENIHANIKTFIDQLRSKFSLLNNNNNNNVVPTSSTITTLPDCNITTSSYANLIVAQHKPTSPAINQMYVTLDNNIDLIPDTQPQLNCSPTRTVAATSKDISMEPQRKPIDLETDLIPDTPPLLNSSLKRSITLSSSTDSLTNTTLFFPKTQSKQPQIASPKAQRKHFCTYRDCEFCKFNRSKNGFTCSDSNTIYLIECTNCNVQYIGNTSRTTRTRIREHMVDIDKNQANSTITKHFNSASCSTKHFSFQILHKDLKDDIARYRMEHDEIKRYGSLWPNGLNQRTPAGCVEQNN